MEQPYHQFTIREFVLDDAFRRWVFQPNEQRMTFWHTFMLRHPEQQAAIDEATSLLLHLNASYDDLTDASQQRIRQVLDRAVSASRISESHARDSFHPKTPGGPLRHYPFVQRPGFGWRMAASLTGLLLIVGVAAYYWLQPKQQRIHTAFGQTRTVTLPDGSTVLLNGNSTLTFALDWSADATREVWLDGEGFFKVAKKQRALHRRGDVSEANPPTPGTPIKFVTHTPGLDITVLGTQFNVNTRRGSTNVMLVEGRVQLLRTDPAQPNTAQPRIIDLKPGQFASAQPTIQQVEVRNEKPQLHTSWVTHQFVFENTPLSAITRQLHDTYGLNVIVEDSALANRRFTGNLSNQSVETLLTTLSITFDLAVHRDGDRIILQRNP